MPAADGEDDGKPARRPRGPGKRPIRELIMVTAERLFATQGIDAVSLREIGIASGQKNTGVVQYHFGDKDNLVRTIYEYRMAVVNDRRLALLEKLKADGRLNEPRAAIEAFVLPLAFELDTDSYYLGFVAQFLRGQPADNPYLTLDPAVTASARQVSTMMRRHLRHLSPKLRDSRNNTIAGAIVPPLANRQQAMRQNADGLIPTELFVADLIDSVTGMLIAPSAEETVALLRTRKPRPTRSPSGT